MHRDAHRAGDHRGHHRHVLDHAEVDEGDTILEQRGEPVTGLDGERRLADTRRADDREQRDIGDAIDQKRYVALTPDQMRQARGQVRAGRATSAVFRPSPLRTALPLDRRNERITDPDLGRDVTRTVDTVAEQLA
ncbi:hypothetical protein FHS96_004863 [Sphingomonas zeicaulis]